nr:MAG: RNA-dependent RNA polymerase [Chemarfal virus 135]
MDADDQGLLFDDQATVVPQFGEAVAVSLGAVAPKIVSLGAAAASVATATAAAAAASVASDAVTALYDTAIAAVAKAFGDEFDIKEAMPSVLNYASMVYAAVSGNKELGISSALMWVALDPRRAQDLARLLVSKVASVARLLAFSPAEAFASLTKWVSKAFERKVIDPAVWVAKHGCHAATESTPPCIGDPSGAEAFSWDWVTEGKIDPALAAVMLKRAGTVCFHIGAIAKLEAEAYTLDNPPPKPVAQEPGDDDVPEYIGLWDDVVCLVGTIVKGAEGSAFDLARWVRRDFKAIVAVAAAARTLHTAFDLFQRLIGSVCAYFFGRDPFSRSRDDACGLAMALIAKMQAAVAAPKETKLEMVFSRDTTLLYRDAAAAHGPLHAAGVGPSLLASFRDTFREFTSTYQAAYARLHTAVPRTAPIVVMFTGGSGLGKSVSANSLSNNLAHALGVTVANSTFPMPAERLDGHWDGYSEQPVLLWEEAFSVKDSDARVADVTAFLALVTTTPTPLRYAHLEGKGTTFFTSPYVVGTTNFTFEGLGGSGQKLPTQADDAITNRLHILVTPIKPEGGFSLKTRTDLLQYHVSGKCPAFRSAVKTLEGMGVPMNRVLVTDVGHGTDGICMDLETLTILAVMMRKCNEKIQATVQDNTGPTSGPTKSLMAKLMGLGIGPAASEGSSAAEQFLKPGSTGVASAVSLLGSVSGLTAQTGPPVVTISDLLARHAPMRRQMPPAVVIFTTIVGALAAAFVAYKYFTREEPASTAAPTIVSSQDQRGNRTSGAVKVVKGRFRRVVRQVNRALGGSPTPGFEAHSQGSGQEDAALAVAVEAIGSSLASVVIQYSDGVRKGTKGFFVGDRTLALVGHALLDAEVAGVQYTRRTNRGLIETKAITHSADTPLRVYRNDSCDVGLIEFPSCVQPAASAWAHLADEGFEPDLQRAFLVDYRVGDSVDTTNYEVVMHKMPITYRHGLQDVSVDTAVRYKLATGNGTCGAVLLTAINGAYKIVGIHVAGDSVSAGFSSLIDGPTVRAMMSEAKMESGAQVFAQLEHVTPAEGLLYGHPGCVVVGKALPGMGSSPVTKSKIKPTAMNEVVVAGVEGPTMRPAALYQPGVEVHAISMAKIPTEPFVGHVPFAEEIRDAFATAYPPCGAGPVSLHEAINGSPGVPGINRQTSMGWPFTALGPSKKEAWMVIQPDGTATLGPDLEAYVRRRWEAANRGERTPTVFADSLKDELRTTIGDKFMKPRVVSACPADYLIVFRRFMLALTGAIPPTSAQLPISVGINVHGPAWGQLASRLSSANEDGLVVDGDFASYDGSIPPFVGYFVKDLIADFYAGDGHEIGRSTVLEELIHSFHIYKSTVFVTYGPHPSGDPATSVWNSIVGFVVMGAAIATVRDKYGLRFLLHDVSYALYGDDNIIAVPDVAFPWGEVPHVVKKLFGMTLTGANKLEAMSARSISEISFLSRKFVVDRGVVHAPMKLARIIEILRWQRDNTPLTAQARIDAVAYELTHHPREVYEAVRNAVLPYCGSGRAWSDATFPTWLVAQYRRGDESYAPVQL